MCQLAGPKVQGSLATVLVDKCISEQMHWYWLFGFRARYKYVGGTTSFSKALHLEKGGIMNSVGDC